jgi:hypothetical protein
MTWQVLQIEPSQHSNTAGSTTIMGEGPNDILAMADAVKRHHEEIVDQTGDKEFVCTFADIVEMQQICGFIVVLHNTTP